MSVLKPPEGHRSDRPFDGLRVVGARSSRQTEPVAVTTIAVLAAALLTAGCGTTTVFERYPLVLARSSQSPPQDPPEAVPAPQETLDGGTSEAAATPPPPVAAPAGPSDLELETAARKGAVSLGWRVRPIAEGRLQLPAPAFPIYPSRSTIDVEIHNGVMTLSGDEVSSGTLGQFGPIFAEATLQALGTQPPGPPLQRKSLGLVTALDLLLPVIAVPFALTDSPYEKPSWGWHVAYRIFLDGVGIAFIVRSMMPTRFERGPGAWPVGAVAAMLVNRLLALAIDLPFANQHNDAAESGLWLDPQAQLPH